MNLGNHAQRCIVRTRIRELSDRTIGRVVTASICAAIYQEELLDSRSGVNGPTLEKRGRYGVPREHCY